MDQQSNHQGWLFTGDTDYIYYAKGKGELYVTGRADNLVMSGGESISRVEIESVLSLRESVNEIASSGLRDERLGQRVAAFIQAKDAVSWEDLDRHCRESDVMNFKLLREYVFVKAIPKSSVGKAFDASSLQVISRRHETKGVRS